MTTTMFPGTRAAIIKNLIGLFERMDVETALSNFTENAHYRFGNYPPAIGKKAIREATMASHLDYIKGISFDIKSMWENADSVICELEINYIRNDGSVLTLPCTDIFRMEGDKVKEMLVYMDPSPLFVAPETKQETILDIAKRLIAAVEANNVEEYITYFAADGAYKIANNPPIIGPQAIKDFALPIMGMFSKVSHDVHNMWQVDDNTVTVELDVTYFRKDGKVFKFPCLNIIRFQGNKVTEYQAFIDANPAFS